MEAEKKKSQFMVRVDENKALAFKAAIKSRGQSVQFILEKAINAYIQETKDLETQGQLK